MAETYFLKKLTEQKNGVVQAMIRLRAGDAYGHAELKGKYEGLEMAESLFRQTIKADDEGMAA